MVPCLQKRWQPIHHLTIHLPAIARCDGTLDDEERGDDMMAAEEPVVVARGITAEDLLRIPGEWLGYDRLALLPDGTLIVDRLDSCEHQGARTQISGACYTFVVARQGGNLELGTGVNLGEQLGPRTPDVVIEERMVGYNGEWVPRVILECVFEPSTSDRYIDMATEYLRYNADVDRVIVFKFCLRRRRVDSTRDDLWEVPALAIVFGLSNPVDRTSPVQIYETQSFGNVGLPRDMVSRLCTPVDHPSFVRLRQNLGLALLEPEIQRVDLEKSLVTDLYTIHRQGIKLMFSVAIPVLGILSFDLLAVFHDATRGRASDEEMRQAGQNPRLVRRAGRQYRQEHRQV